MADVVPGEVERKRCPKLEPIARAIARFLEDEFHVSAPYELEKDLPWLNTAALTPQALGSAWEPVCRIYAHLVDERFALPDRLGLCTTRARAQPADIWFSEPYSFMVEYDEKQHFNQFRLRTLEGYPEYDLLPFDYAGYVHHSRTRHARPGTSGFTCLKSCDPLFPPMHSGNKQDNRTRQRAFRDLLRDVLPATRPDCNMTWRVGAYLLEWKTNGFTEADSSRVVEHLRKLRVAEHLVLDGRRRPTSGST